MVTHNAAGDRPTGGAGETHRARVLVVGGANIDIRARCAQAVVPLTSNPGVSATRPGGVGRNIAENLARLGHHVRLLAPLGRDAFGTQIQAHARQCGIELVAPRGSSGRTGSYLAVLDASGELVVAVSDMAITDALTPADLAGLADLLPGTDLVVIDANIPPASADFVLTSAAAASIPVVIEPVSVAKAGRLAAVLARHQPLAVSLNVHELSVLAGRPVLDTERDVVSAARVLNEQGVQHVWVHRGSRPSILTNAGAEVGDSIEAPPVQVVDVTGGGDAMAAGFVHGLLCGEQPRQAAAFGQMLGALTVTTHDTVLQGLRPGLVEAALAGVDPPLDAPHANPAEESDDVALLDEDLAE